MQGFGTIGETLAPRSVAMALPWQRAVARVAGRSFLRHGAAQDRERYRGGFTDDPRTSI